MMKTTLSFALCAALLAGCQSAPAGNGPGDATASTTSTPATDAATTLPRYHWRLQEATDGKGQRVSALFVAGAEPVQLDFNNGRIAVSRLCNTMSGGYTLTADTLRIGPLASTMMACVDEARSLQARFASVLFNANEYRLTLAQAGTAPSLTLRRNDGHTLVFAGTPTPDTRFGGTPETVFLEVASKTRACSHPLIPGKQCLQVRQIQFDSQGIRVGTPGPFENFYADIEGYQHREGVRNVLRVKRYAIANPPADGASNAYVLDLVVESAQEH